MSNFIRIASGIELLPVLLDLERQPELWNRNTARTAGGGPHQAVSDIWVRFRDPTELSDRQAYSEMFTPVFYPAWSALPHLRPIVFGLMTRLEAVQLGGILITRVPAGKMVEPHNDRGRWHAEFFNTKAYVVLASNPGCYNTCDDETVVMAPGEAWVFNNLKEHSTVNAGETDRVTLIVSLRVE
jgi:hypothetical protein